MNKQQRTALLLMTLTVLIDIAGFGLVIPLLPFWAEHFGADAFTIGMLTSLYALAQFLFTPILGSLSDRYGRKPVIIISLIIEALSFVFTALAGSLPMLLLARFIGGLGASNIGSAQAFVADVTPPEKRAQGMGMIGAAIGLGFVIGPAFGGALATSNQALPFWIAATVAVINALLVLAFLPETHKGSARETKPQNTRSFRRGVGVLFSGWRTATHYPAILTLILVNLIYTIAFTGMENIFPLFTQHYFMWGATQNAYVFTYIGIIVVIMQGGLVNRLVKRWQERGVLLSGLVLMAVGLISLAFSTQLSWLLITLGLLSIGDGAVSPTISTLLSFASPGESQGELLGLSQGFAGLARIIGPLIAGGIYKISSTGMPFIVGGILVVLAALIAVPMLSRVQKPIQPVEVGVPESASSAHD
ncbi:MFS transporter [Ktedonospora formicarum]|uniref:Tetracycline resistance MFS efflux pump n=1 Tax=Ktedonospora formicarum TaxID=2778364 RepID=A0A8J3HUB1_9CHLR|nr:MFS transporter [Ktedonospora formicarum]GHO43416.1 tetracycline resistance MFS efflux pump [Ktedonospora formicarum]